MITAVLPCWPIGGLPGASPNSPPLRRERSECAVGQDMTRSGTCCLDHLALVRWFSFLVGLDCTARGHRCPGPETFVSATPLLAVVVVRAGCRCGAVLGRSRARSGS